MKARNVFKARYGRAWRQVVRFRCVSAPSPVSSRLALAALLVLLAFAASGCLSLLPPLSGDGTPLSPGVPSDGDGFATLLVTVHAAQAAAGGDGFRPAERLRVTLEKPRSSTTRTPTLRREVTPVEQRTVVRFERLETGPWLISAELLDAEGVPMYTGAAEVYVREGETVAADVFLEMVPGGLIVRIDLGDACIAVGDEGQCLHDVANRGHLRLAPGPDGKAWNENFDWVPGERYGTASVNRLTPGDYEFQLIFYRDSRTVGNTLYAGHWVPFRVEPGRTTEVDWHAQAGALDVNVRINAPPLPPAGVTAQWTEQGLLLSWSPSASDNVARYYVWHRTGPRAELVRLHATPDAQVTAWLHADASAEMCFAAPDAGLFYFVTAVSASGLESLRSELVDACALL